MDDIEQTDDAETFERGQLAQDDEGGERDDIEFRDHEDQAENDSYPWGW